MNVNEFEEHVRFWCSLTSDQVFTRLQDIGFTVVQYASRKGFKAGDTIHDRYAYRPGVQSDSPLLVCHADTVLRDIRYKYNEKTQTVISSELDDRLGIACLSYAIANGMTLGECAMLICDNEEIGQTTAEIYGEDSEQGMYSTPNWLMEFDRRGCDVVCYQYENATFTSLLEHVGFNVGCGSFSDISSLQLLGVSGVNVGVGYHREHSRQCHADLNDTLEQLAKAEEFCRQFHGVKLEHGLKAKRFDRWDKYSRWEDDDDTWVNYRQTGSDTAVIVSAKMDAMDGALSLNDMIDDALDNPGYDDDDNDALLLPDVKCDSCETMFPLDDMIDWQGHCVCSDCYTSCIEQKERI